MSVEDKNKAEDKNKVEERNKTIEERNNARKKLNKDYKELKALIKPIKDGDERWKVLPVLSYSALDLLGQCSYEYKLKYIDKKRSTVSSLAMECGTCLHKCLEVKGRDLIEGKETDYEKLKDIAYNGCEEVTEKGSERIVGFNELKMKYMDDYWSGDENNNNMNYHQKLERFISEVLPDRMTNEKDKEMGWQVIATELPFSFVYDDRCILIGFIDRVDKNKFGELRITDYKSSKKKFDDKKIKTPLQHFIYDMACIIEYDELPLYHEYDFILRNEIQGAEDGVCSKGYVGRGIKKINKLLDLRDEVVNNATYKPSPTPLCYWCPYRCDTPNSDKKYGGACDYFSLWRPDDKTFRVNIEWGAIEDGSLLLNASEVAKKQYDDWMEKKEFREKQKKLDEEFKKELDKQNLDKQNLDKQKLIKTDFNKTDFNKTNFNKNKKTPLW